ncbi:hypothetical protein [Hymenobacter sp. YC55]|uniref:hypothetical protein n=1 Tax=Hymenobacter sp. YC55 TaxID=3034019 RepID=UPI0023F8D567|nr:hypothetical protein [Hymenobacter sp. YC55]MDF7811637.1 hypothetical protein [Hymenobacter sp. YC55]
MHYAPFAAEPALDAPNLDIPLYFETIDGLPVAHEEAEAALRSGQAVLVGTLLVGVFTSF